jgi:hypothetical protein
MFPRQRVYTPYGVGRVLEVRSNNLVIEPLSWQLAAGQKPTFYMNAKDVKPFFKEGDAVKSIFGNGTIKHYEGDRDIYVIALDDWKLATGKSPTLFLNDTSFTQLENATMVRIDQLLQKVTLLRDVAKDLYVKRKCEEAKAKYTEAMNTLRVSNTA